MYASSTSGLGRKAWRQRGAVAVVFGLSIIVLFGFMALVIDLGRTYVVRTELQNAADAAALAGAKQLNQTAAGICCGSGSAVAYAIDIAGRNNYQFSIPVSITSADIMVGDCPDESCMVPAAPFGAAGASDSDAANKTFLKVDVRRSLPTFFAVVSTSSADPGVSSTSTFGLAVAGRFVNDITPIGVCAIKDVNGNSRPVGEVLSSGELTQFGFRRGVSYSIFNLGPLGSPSDTYLLNPVDVYPSACDPVNSSANITAPFICSGSSAILTSTPGTVWGNSGISAGKIQAALNSRFNIYGGPSVCIPEQSPPDINIKEYRYSSTTVVDWMAPAPSVQTIASPGVPSYPTTIASPGQYGVLWSYSRAVRGTVDNSVTPPKVTVGTTFNATTSDWATLYPSTGGPAAPVSYPPAGSPYLDSGSTAHYQFQSMGKANRRVLNLAIADCGPGKITGSGACQVIPVLGIGRFFMQVPANFSGDPKKLEVEFAGLIDPVPIAEIKLYR